MVVRVYACLYKLDIRIHNGTPKRRPIKSSHITKLATFKPGQVDSESFHNYSNMRAHFSDNSDKYSLNKTLKFYNANKDEISAQSSLTHCVCVCGTSKDQIIH